MTDHLPECPLLEPCSADIPQHGFCSRQNTICIHCDQNTICIHCERECICDRLRACEERVLAGASEQDYANGKSHGLLDGYEEGYSDALDAAREAVKHLQHSDDCYYAEGVLCHCEIKRVITAIDALKEKR